MQQQSFHIIRAEQWSKEEWNNRIEELNYFGLYCRYEYLQHFCDDWICISNHNRTLLLPVPIRKKMGITYVYTPSFFPQTSIIGKYNEDDIASLTNKLLSIVHFGDLFLQGMLLSNKKIRQTLKTNFTLDTSNWKNKIIDHHRRALEKANKQDFNIQEQVEAHVIIDLFKEVYTEKMPHVTDNDYNRLLQWCEQQTNTIQTYCVYLHGEIHAAAILFCHRNTVYNIINVVTEAGKVSRANYSLYGYILDRCHIQQLNLDWEGSDIPGIARFYEGWGSEKHNYYHYHINALPFPLNYFKR